MGPVPAALWALFWLMQLPLPTLALLLFAEQGLFQIDLLIPVLAFPSRASWPMQPLWPLRRLPFLIVPGPYLRPSVTTPSSRFWPHSGSFRAIYLHRK